MVAPEPLIICSKTLQNTVFCVQHPQNRVWGPTCVCPHVRGGFLFVFSDRQCQGSVALTITAFANLMMACVQIQLF